MLEAAVSTTTAVSKGSTFPPSCPVEMMAPDSSTAIVSSATDALLQGLVRGHRGRALRVQLAERYPECAEEQVEDAVQYACKAFLDEAEDVSAPGTIYTWIRTAAFRYLNREANRRRRELAIDPEDGIATFAADEPGPARRQPGSSGCIPGVPAPARPNPRNEF